MWRSGQYTLDEIAAKMDRSRVTLLRLYNAEGVTKGEHSEQHEKRITEAVEAAGAAEVAELAKRIQNTKEDHYKMSQALSKLVWQLIATCKKEGKSFQTISSDLKALRYASAILSDCRMERFALLGMNNKESEDDKDPEDLVIREITKEEIQENLKKQIVDDDFAVPDIEDMQVEDEEE